MNGGVQQSGFVTPGHFVSWVTNGIIADGGPLLASQKVLASLRSANFNVTSDQPILIPPAIVAFQLTGILITNASVSMSAAAGGFYTQAQKGGSLVVGNTQVYSSLTTPDALLPITLTNFANTTRFSAHNLAAILGSANQFALAIYFSLSTPQGVPSSADIYLLGIDLT